MKRLLCHGLVLGKQLDRTSKFYVYLFLRLATATRYLFSVKHLPAPCRGFAIPFPDPSKNVRYFLVPPRFRVRRPRVSGDPGCGGGRRAHQSRRVNQARAKGVEAGNVSGGNGHNPANTPTRDESGRFCHTGQRGRGEGGADEPSVDEVGEAVVDLSPVNTETDCHCSRTTYTSSDQGTCDGPDERHSTE